MRIRTHRNRTRVAAVVLAGLAGVGALCGLGGPGGLGTGPVAQAVPSDPLAPLEYVALGDSFAAGPLTPDQNTQDLNLLCLRSDHDYPAVVAQTLHAQLTDVSCSGATLGDFSGRQYGLLSPQYDALKPGTDLVTVTIGGNDTDLIAKALDCVNLLPEPVGTSCADAAAASGDPAAAAIAAWGPAFGKALDEISRRSPDAKIIVAGYGTYLRAGGCWPAQPLWARDADHLQGLINRLNGVLRAEAASHRAAFVDLAAVSTGHDTCAAPDERYLEGLVPTSAAAPLHPNARGMAAFGTAVAEAAR